MGRQRWQTALVRNRLEGVRFESIVFFALYLCCDAMFYYATLISLLFNEHANNNLAAVLKNKQSI